MRNENLNLCPQKCCDFGEFKCDVPMPVGSKLEYVDLCISDIVGALNAANIITTNSCCGHSKIDASIILVDGRELIIRKFMPENHISRKIKAVEE